MSRKRRAESNSRKRRIKKGPMDLDITALLDVLVIMLVFLLRSYNSSGVVLSVAGNIQLPRSESFDVNATGVIVQVSPDTIWVDNKQILNKKRYFSRKSFDQRARRIIPLYNELVRKKELIKRIEKHTKHAKKFSGVINLVVDKKIKYTFLKKLMYTCALAGFKTYKFVVLGDEI